MDERFSPCLYKAWGVVLQELGASGGTPDTAGIEGLRRECNRGVMWAICRWQCESEARHNEILNADLGIQTGLAHLAGLGGGDSVIAAIMIDGSQALCGVHGHHLLLHGAG